MKHGGIAALLELLNDGHLEAWASATHTLHMLCSSNPHATLMVMQAGTPTSCMVAKTQDAFMPFQVDNANKLMEPGRRLNGHGICQA